MRAKDTTHKAAIECQTVVMIVIHDAGSEEGEQHYLFICSASMLLPLLLCLQKSSHTEADHRSHTVL